MSRSKGSRYERELVNELRDDGWFAMRIAASGSGTDAELPDIMCANDGDIYVLELKYVGNGGRASMSREKLRGLKWLASQMRATPLFVARFKGDTDYHCFQPSQCKQNAKSITVGEDDCERAMQLV